MKIQLFKLFLAKNLTEKYLSNFLDFLKYQTPIEILDTSKPELITAALFKNIKFLIPCW